MAVHYTGNDADGIALVTNFDLWINRVNTYVTNTGDAFDFGTTRENTLMVYGVLASEDGDGIGASATSEEARIDIYAGGSVSGNADGIELEGIRHTVFNNGEIRGASDNGIELRGNPNLSQGFGQIVNSGSIYGFDSGVVVYFNDNRIINYGTIIGISRGINAVSSRGTRIENHGEISGLEAIFISGASDSTSTTINTGKITGRSDSFTGSIGNDTLINSGTMTGLIYTDDGNDTIRNTGAVIGNVELGTGDDFLGSATGLVTGQIFGGLGADRIVAGIGDDLVHGDDDADEIRGNAGDDTLFGDAGDDKLYGGDGADLLDGGDGLDALLGGSGDDTLTGGNHGDELWGGDGADSLAGGAANDKLYGGNGDDRLDGGTSNDLIYGGIGEDTIIGGFGADQLFGGADADIFIFGLNHSGLGLASDVISGFQVGIDEIDLAAVSPATLVYVANGAFVGGGTASVRVLIPASGQTSILIDHDGNAVADMRILLDNHPAITADDLIL